MFIHNRLSIISLKHYWIIVKKILNIASILANPFDHAKPVRKIPVLNHSRASINDSLYLFSPFFTNLVFSLYIWIDSVVTFPSIFPPPFIRRFDNLEIIVAFRRQCRAFLSYSRKMAVPWNGIEDDSV